MKPGSAFRIVFFGSSCRLLGAAIVGLALLDTGTIQAQPQPMEGPELWAKVQPLLGNREYGAAIQLLERQRQLVEKSAKTSRPMRLIEEHIQIFKELTTLERRAREKFDNLKTGDRVTFAGIAYQVVRRDDMDGKSRIVVKLAAGGRESSRTFDDVRAADLLALVDLANPMSVDDKFLAGILHALDDSGDRDLARRHLSDVADQKPIQFWIARLDAEAQEAEAAANAPDDPIVGSWRLVMGKPGEKQRIINLELKKNGRGEPGGTLWKKSGDNRYTITTSWGGTALLTLQPGGERLTGRTANGTPCGATRQSTAKNRARPGN